MISGPRGSTYPLDVQIGRGSPRAECVSTKITKDMNKVKQKDLRELSYNREARKMQQTNRRVNSKMKKRINQISTCHIEYIFQKNCINSDLKLS